MEDAIAIPKQEPKNEKTHVVYMTTAKAEGLIASDQTGMFPRTSNRGNKYICIFYVYDSNFIKGVPIKSRKKDELLKAYKEIYAYCEQRGYKPQLHKLDNETSKMLRHLLQVSKLTCNTHHQTCTGPIQQREPCRHGSHVASPYLHRYPQSSQLLCGTDLHH